MASAAIQEVSVSGEGFAPENAARPPQPLASRIGWLFAVIGASFAFLYTSLFSLSGIPHLRSGDQAFFWTYASRLLSGQVFLRDFHQFTPPGADLVYAAVFRLFGVSLRSINGTIVCLGVAVAVACFLCARRILRDELVALAGLACVVVLYGDRMDATHHWFSSLANLLAVVVLMRGNSWLRIAGAAALIAIAAFFTQTAGVVGLLACCAGLWWDKRNGRLSPSMLGARAAAMTGIALLVWLLMSGRFIVQAGIHTCWLEQVMYLPRDTNFPAGFLVPHFSASWHVRSLITLADHLLVYLLLLAVCPWVAALCWRRKIDSRDNSTALVLLAALGILQMLEVITVLNWNRMAATAMPAAILAVWLMARTGSRGRRLVMASWWIVGAMILVQSGATQARRYPRLKLPAGDAQLEKDDVDEVSWLVTHTRPGDCFFEVANTRFYVPLALRNPTPVTVLSASDSTLPQWVNESVAGLKQCAARYILWETHAGVGLVDQPHRTKSDHLDPLRAFMQEQYVRTAVFDNGDEIWERKY
jgi:hypothetical protein